MNIKEDLNLFFLHVPKNAGKSILKMYDIKADKKLKRSVVEAQASINHSQNLNINLDKYVKFCVVRNPWDRIVSLYHFRKRETDLYNLFPGANVFGGDKSLPDGTQLSFKEWVMSPHSKAAEFPLIDRIEKERDHKMREMFSAKAFPRKDYLYKMNKAEYNDMYRSHAHYLWLTHVLDWIQQIHFITKEDGSLFVDEILRFETLAEDLEKFQERKKNMLTIMMKNC